MAVPNVGSVYYNTSNYYGFPKIHKSSLIQKVIKEQNNGVINIEELIDLKLGPIVGGSKCLIRILSNLIYILLKPFFKRINSYIKNSSDFLNKC